MRPLQDQCEPTPFEDLENLFLSDIGVPLSELFSELDLDPIGVASLAQVHRGRLRETGQEVAVKVRLETFSAANSLTLFLSSYNIHTWRNSAI